MVHWPQNGDPWHCSLCLARFEERLVLLVRFLSAVSNHV
jgi:hypothetical protein